MFLYPGMVRRGVAWRGLAGSCYSVVYRTGRDREERERERKSGERERERERGACALGRVTAEVLEEWRRVKGVGVGTRQPRYQTKDRMHKAGLYA